MGLGEAEQTDGAVSTATDISWTYSLDLADSLKLTGAFPLWDLKNVFLCVGRKKKKEKCWLKEKLWQCRCENEGTQAIKKKDNDVNIWRAKESFRPFWLRVKDVRTWSAAKKDLNLFPSWARFHSFVASRPRLQTSNGPQDLQQTLDMQLINGWECSFIGQSQLQNKII